MRQLTVKIFPNPRGAVAVDDALVVDEIRQPLDGALRDAPAPLAGFSSRGSL